MQDRPRSEREGRKRRREIKKKNHRRKSVLNRKSLENGEKARVNGIRFVGFT